MISWKTFSAVAFLALSSASAFAGTSSNSLSLTNISFMAATRPLSGDVQDETDKKYCGEGGGFYDPATGRCFPTRGGSNPP